MALVGTPTRTPTVTPRSHTLQKILRHRLLVLRRPRVSRFRGSSGDTGDGSGWSVSVTYAPGVGEVVVTVTLGSPRPEPRSTRSTRPTPPPTYPESHLPVSTSRLARRGRVSWGYWVSTVPGVLSTMRGISVFVSECVDENSLFSCFRQRHSL